MAQLGGGATQSRRRGLGVAPGEVVEDHLLRVVLERGGKRPAHAGQDPDRGAQRRKPPVAVPCARARRLEQRSGVQGRLERLHGAHDGGVAGEGIAGDATRRDLDRLVLGQHGSRGLQRRRVHGSELAVGIAGRQRRSLLAAGLALHVLVDVQPQLLEGDDPVAVRIGQPFQPRDQKVGEDTVTAAPLRAFPRGLLG